MKHMDQPSRLALATGTAGRARLSGGTESDVRGQDPDQKHDRSTHRRYFWFYEDLLN